MRFHGTSGNFVSASVDNKHLGLLFDESILFDAAHLSDLLTRHDYLDLLLAGLSAFLRPVALTRLYLLGPADLVSALHLLLDIFLLIFATVTLFFIVFSIGLLGGSFVLFIFPVLFIIVIVIDVVVVGG